MTEIAVHNGHAPLPAPMPAQMVAPSPLMRWVGEAQQAELIARELAKTSFVPATLRGKPAEITAAILAGQELGLPPMATLRSIDVIQGTPALRAHAMRGLVQSKGHSVQVAESTPERCVVRGRRKGEEEWQTVTWTLDRAKKLGLTGKSEWQKQPQTMLVARATGEICRLVASDVLYAMPYAAEELDAEPVAERVTVEEILTRPAANPAGPPAVEQVQRIDDRPISKPQIAKMAALMREAGITGRDAALAYVADVIGRQVESRNELNRTEAGQVIDALQAEVDAQQNDEPGVDEPGEDPASEPPGDDAGEDWPPVAGPGGGA